MKRYRIGYVALPGFNESELGEMQAVLGINPLNRPSIIGATTKPVTGQHGLTLVPDRVFQDRTPLDVLVIPDIPTAAQDDPAFHAFLTDQCSRVAYVVASSGGVLALAKADVLEGKTATADDQGAKLLADYGVKPVFERRAVVDGKFYTAGHSTGMIEAAFMVLEKLRGTSFAKFAELTLEYDPHPQFTAHTPKKPVDLTAGDAPTIAMALPSGCYLPDFLGAVEVLSAFPNSKLHVVSHDKTPVQCLLGPKVVPTTTFATCPEVDFVIMGATQPMLLKDKELLDFIRRQEPAAKGMISVCAGTLVYAAAGILDGKTATSNFHHTPLLDKLGAKSSGTEVAVDGKFYSAGPAIGSYEVALKAVRDMYGIDVAHHIEKNVLEYAPKPVFGVGSPEKAGKWLARISKYLIAASLPFYLSAGRRGARYVKSQASTRLLKPTST
ncbi:MULTISPECIES: DJ-1/PfpI family protein [unclassified Pseudovibrio]|uniref:DJ-1/PfpI family protein n=1 Tax=unclassified Pseudovibrio TaxID=2627060 RepID=UPI0007AE8B76|nr:MULTISPECIES: DJ-1/PfpI family protein [unclassified Pseudovibrio]KZK98690.1 Isonitrile hydratase [Pseudovibrio sp. W74]KZL09182.1 Isonitrile hydratase [Pseudovibrio sp. Ad14]